MVANGKIRMTVTTDGHRKRPHAGRCFIADVLVRSIEQTQYSLLELRAVMPARGADDLLLAMVLGTAEFSFEEMQAPSPTPTIAPHRANS